jgi:glucose/arabinose dehydrogenase
MSRTVSIRIIFISIFLAAAAIAWQLPSNMTALPQPYATPSVENYPTVVPKPASAHLQYPNGFRVEEWAGGFAVPRFLLQGDDGELLLADSGSAKPGTKEGTIYVFVNGDPNQRKVLIRGLNRPYGLALNGGFLYVGEADSIKRYPYDAKNLTVGRGVEIIPLTGFNRDHWTRSLLFDRAGTKLYVGIGSAADVETGEDPRRAAISRYNPDGSGHELFATGTRNPIGLHWYPDSDTLWAAVQERDELGDDLVPDYFTHIEQGGFYGWPYSYTGQHPDPRIKEQRPDLVASTKAPDVLLGSHVAVLDWTFYTGRQFPEEYRGGAFLAMHGSWNRSGRDGYEVAFIPFLGGKPSGSPRDFITGWRVAPDNKDVWGRPVAVFQMMDGSLLVTDDGGGKIWRVTYSAVRG